MGYKIFDCPNTPNKGRYGHPQGHGSHGGQVAQCCEQGCAPHLYQFYALQGRQELDEAPNVLTDMKGL